jgi:tetratricopeptide (TPR) repeat protein
MRALVPILLITTFVAGQTQSNVATVLEEGEQLIATNQLAAAEHLYEKALHDSPDDPDLHYELGMVFFRQHDWPKAIENYKSSLNSKPGRIKPLFYLAEAYFMQSDLDRARRTIALAANIAPNDSQVCQKYGEYLSSTLETRKDGLLWLQKARHLNSGLPRIDFEIGKTQFALTDYQAAASSFEIALKRDAGDGQAAFYLAESWANLGDWSKARDSYAYAVAHDYAYGPAYYGAGRAHVELGEFDAAIAPLNHAIALDPSLIKAHFQLAKAYRQLGRNTEAQAQTKLFTAMSDRIDTSSELHGSEEEQVWKKVKPLLDANREQEALDLLANLPFTEEPDRAGPLYLLGVMYYSMGRTDDAKRVLAMARAKTPESARVAAYLGMVQLSSGEVVAAETTFQSALALDSNEALALIGMGGIRYQQKRWPESIDYLERSRTADPDALLMLCDAALTSEVIRALGADRAPLLDRLDRLVALHRKDQPQTP